jgi:hypothetical protein
MPKIYVEKSSISLNVAGVLRLERPDERNASKVINHKPAELFGKADNFEQAPRGQLALGRPAKDSAKLVKWNAAGAACNVRQGRRGARRTQRRA